MTRNALGVALLHLHGRVFRSAALILLAPLLLSTGAAVRGDETVVPSPPKNWDLFRTYERIEDGILTGTNAFRREQKLPPVESSPELSLAARYFAEFLADTDLFDHEADGRGPDARAEEYGYAYCLVAENIAMHWRDPDPSDEELATLFVQQWKDSPGHRANMLGPYHTQIGVAVARSRTTGQYYAVQMFGRPKSLMFTFQVENKSRQTVYYSLGSDPITLEDSTTVIHTLCVPQYLSFYGSSAPGEGESKPTALNRVVPKRNDRFVVARDGNGTLTFENKPAKKK